MRAWQKARRCTLTPEALSKRSFSSSRRLCYGRSIADILRSNADAERLSVTGWVRSVRQQKRVAFAAVSDGSTVDSLQAVLRPEDAAELSHGTAVRLTGDWKASIGSGQSHELQVSAVEILGENNADSNPLQPKYQTPEYLRTIPHLRSRTSANALILRLRSQLIASFTKFFNEQDFVQIHTPITTSSDCEGAGEVFTVSSNASKDSEQKSKPEHEAQVEHFYRSPKYLTVSAQLHLEALSQAVNKVWTLSPTFRAEKSDTPRHLSEFYMLEAEMCFVDDLGEIMDLVEDMLRSAVTATRGSHAFSELSTIRCNISKEDSEGSENVAPVETIEQRWQGIAARDWPRITYDEAMKIIEQAHQNGANFAFAPSYTGGLHAEHERYIASHVGKGKPVFVTDYPRAQKPFYMPPSTATRNSKGSADTAACFDLLVPDLAELVGGSLREHRSIELTDAMLEKGVAGGNLEWYQDLRKYGSVPHGGFGLGFDRLLCYLTGLSNVRDVVAFPRWYGRCDC